MRSQGRWVLEVADGMGRHQTTTDTGARPSGRLRTALLRSAGWLAVLLLLALSSPGVRVEPADGGPPAVAGAGLAPPAR